MDAVHLIDRPRRMALAAHSITLRTKLKDWEKAFATSHFGQKPGKEDIKACLEIAKTYKEYNSVRDVLSAKSGTESVDDAARRSPTTRKPSKRKNYTGGQCNDKGARGEAVYIDTPFKVKASLHQRQGGPDLNLIDPHDPPTSVSPRPYVVTAIGPTPQRDGKVLGLFDLLSASGNSSQATPCSRKRKLDTLGEGAQDDNLGNERVVAQTPSRPRIKSGTPGGDILDLLADRTPKGHQRHSRTPASEGKKFRLSQFFATPSNTRFATMAECLDDFHRGQTMDQATSAKQTPLRAHVLAGPKNATVESELSAVDATPAYLKRSYSFKDRLLSVSTLAIGPTDSRQMNYLSPSSIKAGPPTLRRYKSGPKPLSEIVRGLRQMDEERHHDDLDALREMEGGQINVLAGDTPVTDPGTGAGAAFMANEVEAEEENKAPIRVWKKKGQKRTTRRANMRPVKMKPKKENRWVAEDSASEDLDVPKAVQETQLATRQIAVGNVESKALGPDPSLPHGGECGSSAGSEYGSDDNQLNGYEEPIEVNGRGKRTPKDNFEATRKLQKITDTVPGNSSGQKKGPTINPNAVSHQNFRTLKIRNKNSRGKGGRTRFGRKGR